MTATGAAVQGVAVAAASAAWWRILAVGVRVALVGLSASLLTASFVAAEALRPHPLSAATPVSVHLGQLLVLILAAVGGGPLAESVLRRAGDHRRAGRRVPPPVSEVLRGGAAIGVLERLAVSGTLLAGLPGGIAIVVAVKALGRYPELRAPGASERFIIGTLVSLLWAGAAAGAGALLLG